MKFSNSYLSLFLLLAISSLAYGQSSTSEARPEFAKNQERAGGAQYSIRPFAETKKCLVSNKSQTSQIELKNINGIQQAWFYALEHEGRSAILKPIEFGKENSEIDGLFYRTFEKWNALSKLKKVLPTVVMSLYGEWLSNLIQGEIMASIYGVFLTYAPDKSGSSRIFITDYSRTWADRWLLNSTNNRVVQTRVSYFLQSGGLARTEIFIACKAARP